MSKYYAFVGSWSFRPGEKGLSIYDYDPETGKLSFLRRIHPEISVGNQCLDAENQLLYVTDESGSLRGSTVGGYVQAFRIGGENVLTDFCGVETLLPKPSYFALDRSGKYALVAHHSNRGIVTKLVKNSDGTYSSETVTDDAGLALVRKEADGTLKEICDVVITSGEDPYGKHPLSHQHCVNSDPSGELYLVCDKGTDKIYSFRLDREKGKLSLLCSTKVEDGLAPRYVAFHPKKRVVYENNEKKPVLLAFAYHPDTGALTEIDRLALAEPTEKAQSSDLVMDPTGKYLYASVRGDNLICVVELDCNGKMRLKQTVSCCGENPRGLCLAPDGRFLLCANIESNSIVSFAVEKDGTLRGPVQRAEGHIPGNLVIAEVK